MDTDLLVVESLASLVMHPLAGETSSIGPARFGGSARPGNFRKLPANHPHGKLRKDSAQRQVSETPKRQC